MYFLVPPPDVCLLWKDPGPCQDFKVKWFFNSKQRRCSRFKYGGCHGNANRFDMQTDCEKVCVTSEEEVRGRGERKRRGRAQDTMKKSTVTQEYL